MEKTDTYFDPELDATMPFIAGQYPAYISGLKLVGLKEVGQKPDGKPEYKKCNHDEEDTAIVIFDYTVKIAQEAGTMLIKGPDGKEIHPTHMIGKEFTGGRYKIPTLQLNVDEKNRWRNEEYIKFHEGLGLEFPTKKVDKKTIKQLAKVEPEDVIGIPVWITLAAEPDQNNPDRSYMKIRTMRLRDNADRIPPDDFLAKAEEDDLPF